MPYTLQHEEASILEEKQPPLFDELNYYFSLKRNASIHICNTKLDLTRNYPLGSVFGGRACGLRKRLIMNSQVLTADYQQFL